MSARRAPPAAGAGGAARAPLVWLPDASGGAAACRPHTVASDAEMRVLGAIATGARMPPWASRYAVPRDAHLN